MPWPKVPDSMAVTSSKQTSRQATRRKRSYTTATKTSQKLLMLMRRLGLEYGAIDLRLTPDGEYVFFEVNPAGQFLFVEHACGLPISAALAGHLARGKTGHGHQRAEVRAA